MLSLVAVAAAARCAPRRPRRRRRHHRPARARPDGAERRDAARRTPASSSSRRCRSSAPSSSSRATATSPRRSPRCAPTTTWSTPRPTSRCSVSRVPNDAYFGSLWGLYNTGRRRRPAGIAGADIDAPDAWDQTEGAGVTVAVVDTGVDAAHVDLAGQIAGNAAEHRRHARASTTTTTASSTTSAAGTSSPSDNVPQDGNGHGTHVAGTIAAAGDNDNGVIGVAPQAKVLPLRALDDDGSGWMSDIAAAFDYAGDQGVRIVNASLGGGYSRVLETVDRRAPEHALRRRRRQRRRRQRQPDRRRLPVRAAAGQHRLRRRHRQPRRARVVLQLRRHHRRPVRARASSIRSTYKARRTPTRTSSGTSMAAPHVAGAAALALSPRTRRATTVAAQVGAAVLGRRRARARRQVGHRRAPERRRRRRRDPGPRRAEPTPDRRRRPPRPTPRRRRRRRPRRPSRRSPTPDAGRPGRHARADADARRRALSKRQRRRLAGHQGASCASRSALAVRAPVRFTVTRHGQGRSRPGRARPQRRQPVHAHAQAAERQDAQAGRLHARRRAQRDARRAPASIRVPLNPLRQRHRRQMVGRRAGERARLQLAARSISSWRSAGVSLRALRTSSRSRRRSAGVRAPR